MKFIKNWLVKQLTEVSAWIGVGIMVAAILHLSSTVFFVLGLLLLLADEEALKEVISQIAPALKSKIETEE